MTINNPTEADGVLVRNPNEKYIRQLIWTPEIGADGTPHVQAWLRLQRNQTLAFVKKLYPRAHLKPLTKDGYNENTQAYAQKDDETTAGHHVISMNDPLPGVDTILYRVLEQAYTESTHENKGLVQWSQSDMLIRTRTVEDKMVSERAGLEKLFISGTYDKMKRRFYHQIISRLLTKHADDDTCSEASSGVLGGEHVQEVNIETIEEDGGKESDQDTEGGGSEDSEGDSGDEVCSGGSSVDERS